MPISDFAIPGIGSGLDIKEMVEAIANAQIAPKEASLKRQEDRAEMELSSLGKVFGAAGNLLRVSRDVPIGRVGTFVESAEPDRVAVTVTGEPVEGVYQVDVRSLVQAYSIESAQYPNDSNLPANDDRFSSPITMEYRDTETGRTHRTPNFALNSRISFERMAELYTRHSGGFFTVEVVIDRSQPDGKSIRVTVNEAGAGKSVRVISSGFVWADFVSSFQVVQEAHDTEFTVDGDVFTGRTNRFDNVIPGLSIELLRAEPGHLVPITVTSLNENDIEKIVPSLEAFVESCNQFIVTSLAAERGDVKNGLPGSSLVRNLGQQFERAVARYDASLTRSRALTDIGITRQRDGSFSFSSSKFRQAYQENPREVYLLLRGEQGVITDIIELLENMDRSDSGLQSRGRTLEQNLRDFTDRHVELDMELEQIKERLLRKYSSMDQKVGRYKQIGSSLELLQSLQSRR